MALLDYLESNELVVRGLAGGRVGQVTLVGGSLTLMDLTLFRGIWSLPAVREGVKQGQQMNAAQQAALPAATGSSRQQRRAEQRQGTGGGGAKLADDMAIDAMLAVVGMLPHTIQVRLVVGDGGGAVVWASLRDDAMVVSAADLVLKHGMAVAGEWKMLGILDALPDSDAAGNFTPEGIDGITRAVAMGDGPFGKLMLGIMPQLRTMLGRPFDAHGMTPLLIYRVIAP